LNPAKTVEVSDVCINGMFLNYRTYFGAERSGQKSIVDFVISQRMGDGGFNCHYNKFDAKHSSLLSTISVSEGIREYFINGYSYRLSELLNCESSSREFMLRHELFKSDHSGEIIDKQFLMLSYPSHWWFDVLRALDYFRLAEAEYDKRLKPSIEVLLKKQRKGERRSLQARHPGKTHFEMEIPGKQSRWNTLRFLRVLRQYD